MAHAGNELSATLEMFDPVAVNPDSLQQAWDEMTSYTHISGVFIHMGDLRYDELTRQFDDLATSLPPIHGYVITPRPMRPDEAGQLRMDAMDVPEALPGLQHELDAPGEAFAEYELGSASPARDDRGRRDRGRAPRRRDDA